MIIDKDAILTEALKRSVAHLKRQIFVEGLKRKPLVFGFENSKIKNAYTFSLPSGWTCPGALTCLAKVNRETGKLTASPTSTVRCFSASQEAVYPTVRLLRWHNLDRLNQAWDTPSMAGLILESIPADAKRIRIHVAGDFFSQAYLDAWIYVAEHRPRITFYAYTKSIPFWLKRTIPANLHLNASLGSRYDAEAVENELKSARIVFSEKEAADFGLEIDEDDSHAWVQDKHFALLVHGTQNAGSEASKAWGKQLAEIRKENAGRPQKVKRLVPPPTVASLTAQIIRLAKRLADILATPEFKVKRFTDLRKALADFQREEGAI